MTSPPPETAERRRSQRIPLSVDLFARSLDSPPTFRGKVQTVEVSGHGCVLVTFRPLKHDTRMRIEILRSHRTTTAHVVHSDPAGTPIEKWKVALEFDKPGNFWKVTAPPPDWPKTSEQRRSNESPRSGSVRGTNQGNQH